MIERRIRMASAIAGPYVGQCIDLGDLEGYLVLGVEPDPDAVLEISDISRQVAWDLGKAYDPQPLMTRPRTVMAVVRPATQDEVEAWRESERQEFASASKNVSRWRKLVGAT